MAVPAVAIVSVPTVIMVVRPIALKVRRRKQAALDMVGKKIHTAELQTHLPFEVSKMCCCGTITRARFVVPGQREMSQHADRWYMQS